MTEEEKKVIENIKDIVNKATPFDMSPSEYIKYKTILNIIEKQEKDNKELRNKNNDLLRKLKNRVKEVKKLTRYSLYKKEFKILNEQIKEKEKEIERLKEYEWMYKDLCD